MAVSTLGRATEIERTGAAAAGATHLLYERHSAAIFRYCLSQLRSRPEAEDAVQTTFMYALRALERGVVPQIEIAWLLKIAQNVCRTTRKTAARRAERELASDPTVLAAAAPAPERHDAELMGLDTALAALPENQRRAVLLREWQGLSYAEIARTMKLSQAAVEMLLFRARRSLAESLGGESQPKRRRIAQFLDLGWLAWLKALAGGTSIAKTAAAGAAAVIAVGALAASDAPALAGADAPESRGGATRASVTAPAASPQGSSQRLSPTRPAIARAARADRARPGANAATHRPTELPAPADTPVAEPGQGSTPSGSRPAASTGQATVAGPPETPEATAPVPPPANVEAPAVSPPQLPAVPSVPDLPTLPTPEVPAVGDVTESLPTLPELPPLP